MSYPSALVLDSGVGGLSIVAKIREICTPLQIHYLADLAGFPYGIKSEAELLHRVISLLESSLPIYQPDLVVIACNTASTLVLDELRQRFSLPFVGVVPAIKPAAQLTQTGVIAILATEGTVKRDYTHKLIQDFAAHHQVLRHGSSNLVLLAEQKLRGNLLGDADIEREVEALKKIDPRLDTVVLACTHFPLLKEELSRSLPHIRYWVDSGDAIARRVQYWLDHLGIRAEESAQAPVNHFLLTGPGGFEYNTRKIEDLLGRFEILRVSDESP